ncbi:MAG: class I SAM-dependent methyltransferase [Vulcanimicrobiota bacterium]
MARDKATADSFANSWNHLGQGSVYSHEQFLDWIAPLKPEDLAGAEILELGFGNGSLLVHAARCGPQKLSGVDLGDTQETARRNLANLPAGLVELHRGDLTRVQLGQFDIVYCIGVLHHLAEPREGFDSVLRHTRPGGRFHCWVYGWEGNLVVRLLVEPIRKVACRLPWWINKYFLALPLSLPFYAYCQALARLPEAFRRLLPLKDYALWISKREWSFFHHVAFDQLVTPRTVYLKRDEIEEWLRDGRIQPGSGYIQMRNGNSWKFGGIRNHER